MDIETRKPGRPPKPGGPAKNRSVKFPDAEWRALSAAAEGRGETVADVLRKAARAYVRRHGVKPALTPNPPNGETR